MNTAQETAVSPLRTSRDILKAWHAKLVCGAEVRVSLCFGCRPCVNCRGWLRMRALPLLNQLAEYPVVRKDHSLQRDRNWWQIPCKRREVRMQVWPSGKRSVLNWLRGHFKSRPAVSQTAGIYRLGRRVLRES